MKGFVGQSSRPVANEVEKGAIRRFAAAIGDDNPLYRDENFARQLGYRSLVAPPTFPRTFDFGAIPGWTLPTDGLIHGEERIFYHRPVVAGDVLYCRRTLVDVFEKSGSIGQMIFLVFHQVAAEADGDVVVELRSSIIHRPTADVGGGMA